MSHQEVVRIALARSRVTSTVASSATERSLLSLARASLACLRGVAIAYGRLAGDPTLRLAALSRNFEQTQVYWFVEGGQFGWQPGEYWEALFHRLFVRGPERIFLSRAYAHLPLAAVVVCMIALRIREQRLAFCGLWLGSLLLLFNFGTTSLDYYKPLVLFQRYLYPLVLPSVLLVAGFLALLRRGGMREWPLALPRIVAAAIVCLPIVRGTVAGLDRELARPVGNFGVREVAMRFTPEDRLVTDPNTMRDLRFFWGYPERDGLEAFDDDVRELPARSFVFVNRERIRLHGEYEGREAPPFWHDLPEHWQLTSRVHEGEVYRVISTEVMRLGHR